MINPETLDLNSLPWLPLDAKSAFPKQPAIYFAIDENGTVQYIGRSVNLRRRWNSHHKYHQLKVIGNIKIAYLFFNEKQKQDIEETEYKLIQWFKPSLNIRHTKMSKKTKQELSDIALEINEPLAVFSLSDIRKLLKDRLTLIEFKVWMCLIYFLLESRSGSNYFEVNLSFLSKYCQCPVEQIEKVIMALSEIDVIHTGLNKQFIFFEKEIIFLE